MSKGLSQTDNGIYDTGVITIDPSPPVPSNPPIASGTFNPPGGSVNAAYSYATAGLFTGGVPTSYALIGTLPSGLSFDVITGAISGFPSTEETSGNLSVTASNNGGSDTTNTDTITIAAQQAGWAIVRDFNDGVLGTKAQNSGTGGNGLSDAFRGAAGQSVYSDSHVIEGVQSCAINIDQGQTGFGKWGGEYTMVNNVGLGEQIWWRQFYYIPASFNFSATGGGLKCMRLRNTDGYFDIYIRSWNDDKLYAQNEAVQEFYDNNPPESSGTPNASGFYRNDVGPGLPREQWVCLEFSIKMDRAAGIWRIWQDGILVFEDLVTRTMNNDTNELFTCYNFTYWNGGSPATQSLEIDYTKIQTITPGDTDLAGNPMIGTEGLT